MFVHLTKTLHNPAITLSSLQVCKAGVVACLTLASFLPYPCPGQGQAPGLAAKTLADLCNLTCCNFLEGPIGFQIPKAVLVPRLCAALALPRSFLPLPTYIPGVLPGSGPQGLWVNGH